LIGPLGRLEDKRVGVEKRKAAKYKPSRVRSRGLNNSDRLFFSNDEPVPIMPAAVVRFQ